MASGNVKVFNCIDDIICIHEHHKALAEFEILCSLFEILGIPVNPKKVVQPVGILTCIGIQLESEPELEATFHSSRENYRDSGLVLTN